MSTIFGIYSRNNKIVKTSNIVLMEQALSYWRCDEENICYKDSVVIGHRMLWNTPESFYEHLPLHKDIYVLSMDGRIDNREELFHKLILPNRPILEIADSEFVLAAYIKWGEACPKYLLGDFVFVIWDANKEQLFCARDQIGIKSLYYYLSNDLFVFSNDIRGVIAHPEVNKKYSDRSIAMFLAGDNGFQDNRDTFFQAIKKLPPATCITITKDHVSESIYWDIDDIVEIHYDTYEEYVEKLRTLLTDAVKVRLRTVYPVASHLSGGIDSAAVAVLAARELEKTKEPLHVFNWIKTPIEDHDPEYCEWGFADHIASIENIEQKKLRITGEFIVKMYEEIDITTDDTTFFWEEYLVRDEAQKHTIRTILSGWGGDELISYNGYAYLSGLFWTGHFIKAIQIIHDSYKGTKYKYLRIIKRLIKELLHPLIYRQMVNFYNKKQFEPDPYQYTKRQFSRYASTLSFEGVGFKAGVHNHQKVYFKYGHLLQRIENWGSSAFAKQLEYRYPLLDKRIVEFALAIPEDMYTLKDGHQRYFFRSAVSNFLPSHIAWAPKLIESIHGIEQTKVWNEALVLWIQRNEDIKDDKSNYVDRSKIIERLKLYFAKEEQNNHDKSISAETRVVGPILLLNLKR